MISTVIATDILEGPKGDTSASPFKLRAMDGNIYYVKLPLSSQPRLLCNETVGSFLARNASLPVPPFALVEVPQALGGMRPQNDLPAGIYFGSRVLPGAFDFRGGGPISTGKTVDVRNAGALPGVVVFDNVTMNGDRNNAGNNLLVFVDNDGKTADYYMIDFGHCFCGPTWTTDILHAAAPSRNPVGAFPFLVAEIKKSDGRFDAIEAWLADLATAEVDALIPELPASWRPPVADAGALGRFIDGRKIVVMSMLHDKLLPGQT